MQKGASDTQQSEVGANDLENHKNTCMAECRHACSHITTTLTEPWKNISVDFTVGLTEAMGFDALLVVVDCAKKQMHSIILDHRPQFAAELMKELNKLLGIQTKLSITYHPQTDGQMECMNQEIKQYFQLFVLHQQHNWPGWVAIAKFSYNNNIHASIEISPFFANYGFNPKMGSEPNRQTKVEAVDNFTKWMKFIHKEAQAALTKAKEEMKHYVITEIPHSTRPVRRSG